MTRYAPSRDDARADDAADELDLLDELLIRRAVRPLLQPIVDLETGAPAGYEALARGPVDHPLHTPDALFAAARRHGRLDELDILCRERALEAAQAAELRAPAALLINIEPAAVSPVPTGPIPHPTLARLRERGVHVLAELTERALTDNPARLLAFADHVRDRGCGIALDDIGADPASLALMPLLRPDVVKLDLRLIQHRPDAMVAQTMTAVTAYAETHGVAVVAEGIETEEHERTALSLGATHGQGWRYGRPTAPSPGLGSGSAPWHPIVPASHPPSDASSSGYALARRSHAARRGTKRLLSEVSRLLERQAADMGELAVVLATVEDDQHFGPRLRARYSSIAERAALVAVIGAGVSAEPAPGVRGVGLDAGDPLLHEWDLVVVGPHFGAALIASDLRDSGPETDRRFDYVLTYDRPTVLEVARSLLGRVGSSPLHVPTSWPGGCS